MPEVAVDRLLQRRIMDDESLFRLVPLQECLVRVYRLTYGEVKDGLVPVDVVRKSQSALTEIIEALVSWISTGT